MVGKEGENFSLLLGVRVGNKGGVGMAVHCFFFFVCVGKLLLLLYVYKIFVDEDV